MASGVNALIAGIIAIITSIVSWRVMNKEFRVNNPLLAVCIGGIAGLGLLTHAGGIIPLLLMPYEAFGVALVVMFLLKRVSSQENSKSKRETTKAVGSCNTGSEDPWEKEIRTHGKLANKYNPRKKK